MESNLVPAMSMSSMPPLKRAPVAATPTTALRSELTALRQKEGRLDALLQSHSEVLQPFHSVNELRVRSPQFAPVAPTEVANVSNVSYTEITRTDAFPLHRSAPSALKAWRDPARSPVSGQFVFDLDIKRFFFAWADICKHMRTYWRQRRDENSRKWLGSRSKALALWSFFGSLKRHVDQPLPEKPLRGIRVKEKTSPGRPGTFFSASEKGICKILLDGQEEVCFRPAEQLLEIAALPHPFLAGLAFLAWTLCHAQDEDLKIDGLRTALMFNQIMGKSSGKLTMLAVMQEEAGKGLKFCFNAWKKAMKSKSLKQFKLKKQREIFRAWLEILLMDQHDRALEILESTQGQLKGVQMALQRRIDQCERVKVKVEKVHLLRLDFFLLLVLQSWRMSCTYRRAQEEGKRDARTALAMSALQLSDSMTKKTTAFVTPHFQAWAARVKHAKKVKRAAEGTISAMLGSSLSLVFNAWKLMKMSDFQMVQAQLQRREREFNELQEISQSFFTFSQENVERLKNMESALQAADRALQIGAARGDSLEVEVQKLQKALKQQAEEAGSRGEKLKEDMERKGQEEMEALAENTAKVKAELEASREMEARLQRLWQGGEGDLQESEVVLELREHLAQAQKEAEILRSSRQMQAERCRAAEEGERRAAAAAQQAKLAVQQAEEAAMEAEEMARLEELAAEAAQERWNATLQRPAMAPSDTVTLNGPGLSDSPRPAAATSSGLTRGDGPMILQPGISTQTSMPPEIPERPDSSRVEAQQKYKDAWRPRGRNLIDTTNEDLMTFDLAMNILSTGAYFKKKAGRRSSVKRYFFIGYASNTTGFLKYFKDHAAAQAGQEARGAFDLMDLVRANWDGAQNSITLTQSTKKDSSERGLTDIPETFFHALLFGVHEAEFRRQYPEYRG